MESMIAFGQQLLTNTPRPPATTLHLSVVNDGATYTERHHMARKYLAGYWTRDEFRKAVRALCQQQARHERERFGSKFTAAQISAAAKLAADYMAEHEIECIAGDIDPARPIMVSIRRWFDKVNGNSYFSLRFAIPQQGKGDTMIYAPMDYGYGSHPEFEAVRWLVSNGIIERKPGATPSGHGITFVDYGYGLKREL